MTEYRYPHPFSPEAWEATKIENLINIFGGMNQLLKAANIKTVRYIGARRIVGPCPINGCLPRRKDRNRWQACVNKDDFLCEGGGGPQHRFELQDLVRELFPKNPARRKFLESIRIGDPQPVRGYVFETLTDDDQRGVALDPDEALSQLDLNGATTVRGTLLEAGNLALVRQLAGQVNAKLPFNEAVKVNELGKLSDYSWHGCWMTMQEKVRQQSEKIRARSQRIKAYEVDVEQFEYQRRKEAGL